MKQKIHIKEIVHRGEPRLRLDFPYNQEIIQQVKQLPGSAWSQTKKCWHLPDNEESRIGLGRLTVDKTSSVEPVNLTITPKKLFLRMKKQTEDIQFVRSLNARWNASNFVWEITAYEPNLSLIRTHFKGRLVEQTLEEPLINEHLPKRTMAQHGQISVYTREGRLRLSFQYDTAVITFIKTLPYPVYDQKNRWWSVPDTEVIRKDLSLFAEQKGLQLRYSDRPTERERQPRPRKEDNPNYRTCPDAFVNKLKTRRYSPNTIRTYTDLFEEFINYYPGLDPKEISEKDIMQFLRYLVDERQISTSYQNQSINAIKRSTPDSTTNRYWAVSGSSIFWIGLRRKSGCRWC